MKSQEQIEYEKLCDEIWEHNRRYYVEHQPTISDEEFDALMHRLNTIEKAHPEWILPTSPTQRIGEATTSGFKTVTHTTPMLSLANTYSKEELIAFIERMQRLTDRPHLAFSCELKMDGIAVSLRYEHGIYVRGLTRGDGKRGDDVTANIKTIEALPLKLYGKDLPEFIEVRGEVFMPHDAFEELNKQREKTGEPLWANPRNAAAGSLKLLDPKEVATRNLNVIFYGIAESSSPPLKSQYEVHHQLQKYGLPTLHYLAKCHNVDEIWSFAEKIRELRSKLAFDIDGIVVKLDNLQDQAHLGATGKNPRWAVAYKFAAEQAVTRILDITVQVGRTGILTPVAELEPVFLAGSNISRATLHNQEEVQRKDIRIHDTVTIEKGGDVIPKVVNVHLNLRPTDSKPWKMPLKCPNCDTEIVHVSGEVAVRCPNPNCTEQRLRRLIHFAGKSGMDIDGLGVRIMEQLVQKGFVTNPSDIYQLTENELAQLEGFKEKSIHNLLISIENSKNVSLSRFLMALGIPHIGIGTAELLANRLGTIEALFKVSEEDLIQIEGIGGVIAKSIVEHFQNHHSIEEIHKLLKHGIRPYQEPSKTISHHHPFAHKIFVLTGTLEKFSRAEAVHLIKERGGKVVDSVSKNTDYLLVGDSPGSKLEKAHKLKVKVLIEAEFITLL